MKIDYLDEFRKLNVWQWAMDFAEQICILTSGDEVFTVQVERAGISVAANIAEGMGCLTEGRKISHFRIARGSLAEAMTFIELMYRLRIFKEKDFDSLFRLGDMIYKKLTELIH